VLILKINFKNKKYYFNIFSNKKYLKKQYPSHFHEQLKIIKISNFTDPNSGTNYCLAILIQ
jgi:hypothetical protein